MTFHRYDSGRYFKSGGSWIVSVVYWATHSDSKTPETPLRTTSFFQCSSEKSAEMLLCCLGESANRKIEITDIDEFEFVAPSKPDIEFAKEVLSALDDQQEADERMPKKELPPRTVAVINEGNTAIVIDDHCYCIRNWNGKKWGWSAWIFREALEAIRTLPFNPDDAKEQGVESESTR